MSAPTPPTDPLAALLDPDRLVDLTQPLGEQTPLWPGTDPIVTETLFDYPADSAYLRHYRSFPEHAGTHFDAPRHFAGAEAATTEAFAIGKLVRPCAMLDVRRLCDGDPAFTLSRVHVEELEARDGPLAAGSAVLVCTGWDAHVGDLARYAGVEEPSLPGIGPDAAELFVERGLVGVGIDSPGIDPGYASESPAHRITLPAGMWHLEGLVGLERLPARGAWIVAAVVPAVGASGFPARVFAILPPPGSAGGETS